MISVNWIVKVTMDYDCAVRMAILQVCLTEEEFHDVCDILCRDLFLADKGEFDLGLQLVSSIFVVRIVEVILANPRQMLM